MSHRQKALVERDLLDPDYLPIGSRFEVFAQQLSLLSSVPVEDISGAKSRTGGMPFPEGFISGLDKACQELSLKRAAQGYSKVSFSSAIHALCSLGVAFDLNQKSLSFPSPPETISRQTLRRLTLGLSSLPIAGESMDLRSLSQPVPLYILLGLLSRSRDPTKGRLTLSEQTRHYIQIAIDFLHEA